jgi:hypothetical protein
VFKHEGRTCSRDWQEERWVSVFRVARIHPVIFTCRVKRPVATIIGGSDDGSQSRGYRSPAASSDSAYGSVAITRRFTGWPVTSPLTISGTSATVTRPYKK